MQRLLFSILLSFFVFASCSKSKPKDILPEKKMIALLKEVHIADAYLNTLSIDSARKVIDSYYAHIFAEFGLDSVSFAANMSYYLGRPNVAEKLYESVITDFKSETRGFELRDSIQNAETQDSMRRVQRDLDEFRYARSLITNVYIDTTKLTYHENMNIFYSKIPMRFNIYGRDIPWQTPIPIPDTKALDVPVVDSAEAKTLRIDSTANMMIKPVVGQSLIPLQVKPVDR